MKYLISLLAIFTSLTTFSQIAFKLETSVNESKSNFVAGTYKTLEKYVVIEGEGTAAELYKKTLGWINETYNTPEEVIKGKVEGEYIRFQGSPSTPLKYVNALGIKAWDGYRYMVEVRFKDGRVKFEPTQLEVYTAPSTVAGVVPGWSKMGFSNRVTKSNGKIDRAGDKSARALRSYFNNLAQSLEKYYKEGGSDSKDDW